MEAIRDSFYKTDKKHAPAGPLDWIKVLKKISDDDLKIITGTDAALYIIFLRLAATFYFIMMIFSLVVLIPLYASGDPLPSDNEVTNP